MPNRTPKELCIFGDEFDGPLREIWVNYYHRRDGSVIPGNNRSNRKDCDRAIENYQTDTGRKLNAVYRVHVIPHHNQIP